MSVTFERALSRLAKRPDHTTMATVTACAASASVTELAHLTRVLANSGGRLTSTSSAVVDIASSGGPGSLSTLLAPLYACALGARVAKVAVPGRPAGGLDVLASLPGYLPDPNAPAARRIFDECGYVHIAAGNAFCPLDAKFFAWRQANGAQAVPNLAITSLLAKKLAAGVGRVVFDIRVGPYGNLGATTDDARRHAQRIVEVAAELGIEAICALTGAQAAPQPWIGRGEALLALALVLDDKPDDALRRHAHACLRMARLATANDDPPDGGVLAEHARAAHESMLAAHGTDPQAFWSRQRAIANAGRHVVVAERGGTFHVDLGEVRRVLVERQRTAAPVAGARFADPGGLELGALDGAAVVPGAPLARVRDDDDPVHLAGQIAAHLSVTNEPPSGMMNAPMEIIRG